MTILPLQPAENASPAALRAFLEQCRAVAARDGHWKLVSISLAVDALDPLAVLESIFEPGEPHFYTERASIETAIAGAEVAVAHEGHGPGRFASVQAWMDETLAHTIAVGDVNAPFGGPHFFAGFTFFDQVEPGEPFSPAFAFVPRWQVSLAGTTTTAVANLRVDSDSNIDAVTERVWRAHGKFRRFEYAERPGGAGSESGTAVPAVGSPGQDARATSDIHVRQGAYLPHWTRDGAVYSIAFRLHDSLPPKVLEQWKLEREAIEQRVRNQKRSLTDYERLQLEKLYSERIENYLDAGRGECHLRRPEIASIVADALRHFDGERYVLHAWCVMPNHVHVVVQPVENHSLDDILHSWKSFSAKAANKALGREGEFWQPEYYDHLIRDEPEYSHAVEYVRRNPEKAGLKDWRWVGGGSGSGTGVSPVMGKDHGQDARATLDHGRDARATFTVRESGDYRAAVAQALERIERGEFKKIVLARAQDLTADRPLHPLRMLNGLRQRFPECYSFSFTQGRGPSFIGASPERLVRVTRGVVETEALAGSIQRGGSASEDAALANALQHSEKDRREQQEVLQDIIARLSPLGLQPEHAPQPQIRRLANVQHLHTSVRATLREGVRLLDVVAAMHPTPAVGGSPRNAAIARIRELEGFPRGLYAGALGWLNARGGGEFFVGIRSALIAENHARLFAGAGIVAGSTPEKEFAETELKFKAMRDALQA